MRGNKQQFEKNGTESPEANISGSTSHEPVGVREVVVIRSPDGGYLARGHEQWVLTENLTEATVFQSRGGAVEKLIENINQALSIELEAVAVALHQLHETCDSCREAVDPMLAYYNGKDFLCPHCSKSCPATYAE